MFQREKNNFKLIFVHQKSSVQKTVTSIFKTKIDSQKKYNNLIVHILSTYLFTFHPHIIKIKFQDLIMHGANAIFLQIY